MRKIRNLMEVNEMALNILITPIALTLMVLGFLTGFGKILMWSAESILICETIWFMISVMGISMILISYFYNRNVLKN